MKRLMLISASARALAQSAQNGGYAFDAFDFFRDWDLVQLCNANPLHKNRAYRISSFDELLNWHDFGRYDGAIIGGGCENNIPAVNHLASNGILLGPSPSQLERLVSIGSLSDIQECCIQADVQFPKTVSGPPEDSTQNIWLEKSLKGCGGGHIRVFDPQQKKGTNPLSESASIILQEKISGHAISAIFLSTPTLNATAQTCECRLVACTRQIVGDRRLGAKPYSYCGSVGPIPLDHVLQRRLEELGSRLTKKFELIGFLGIDLMVNGSSIYLVDINPRITASTELFEIDCSEQLNRQSVVNIQVECCRQRRIPDMSLPGHCRGKAILFCRMPEGIQIDSFIFDHLLGRFARAKDQTGDAIADIPHPGTKIAFGDPILTIFTNGDSVDEASFSIFNLASQIYKIVEDQRS